MPSARFPHDIDVLLGRWVKETNDKSNFTVTLNSANSEEVLVTKIILDLN